MANTDIRLLLSFRNHHKTKKLRFKLGNDAVLSFIWLMMFAAESKPAGILDGMDAEDIALAADWQGDATEFVDVLVAVRYLDLDGHTYSIHDWEDNNPWAAGAPDRSEKARHAANVRHGKDKKPATKNQTLTPKNAATSTTEQCAEQTVAVLKLKSSNAPSPSPSPSPSPIPVDTSNRGLALEVVAPRKRVASEQGHRLPEGWQPSEALLAWTVKKRPGLDVKETLDSFTDHWRSTPGRQGRKSDWDATWRNWVRRENGTPRQNRNGTGSHAVRETAQERVHRQAEEGLRAITGAAQGGGKPPLVGEVV